jgi:integrase
MAIYPDKKDGKLTGKFRVEVQLEGLRKRGRFATYAEAQAKEKAWRAELASGQTEGAAPRDEHTHPRCLSQLLVKAAPLLWDGSAHGDLAEGKVKQLIAWLEVDPQLSKIGTFVDDAVIRLRKEGRAPGTINRYLSALHAVLKWGFKRKLLPDLPEFSWQDEDEGRIRWLTPNEEQRLVATLQALGYVDIADFVIAALDTGCRRSELLHAAPDQLDGRWLRLWDTKNGKARSVPLSARTQAILASALPWQITEAQLRYAWNKAKVAMGLSDDEDFVLHACRHTRATRLVEMNVNLSLVQKFMGHKDIKTTLRYTHISDDALAEVANQIDGWNFVHLTTPVGAVGGGLEPTLPVPTSGHLQSRPVEAVT